MCGCNRHHDPAAKCTCICKEHANFELAYNLAMERYDRIRELEAEVVQLRTARNKDRAVLAAARAAANDREDDDRINELLIEAYSLLRDFAGRTGHASLTWTGDDGTTQSLWVSGPAYQPDDEEVDVELAEDDDRINELEALLADARRALDEIRPVVEHVDNEVTYDGSWGEILMDGIKRIEAERDRLANAVAAVRALALNPQTINAAAGGGNLVTQVPVVYPENIFVALEARDGTA